MVTVTATAKSTKNLKVTTNTATFDTTSASFVDVTSMSMTSIIDDATVGMCVTVRLVTSGIGTFRLTESTPSSDFVTHITTTTVDERIIVAGLQDAGSTQTVKMQAKSSSGNFARVGDGTNDRSRIFSTEFAGGIGTAPAANLDTIAPYKVNVDELDVICLSHTDFGSGSVNGIITNCGDNVEPVVAEAKPHNILTDGFHFVTNIASVSAIATGKSVVIYDFIGVFIEVDP